eukprot:4622793-Karenia_brevis.AAC.1
MKTQSFIYDSIVSDIYPDRLANTIRARAHDLAPGEASAIDLIDFENVRDLLSKVPASAAIAVLKCWANAWTTSSRMHEATQSPCILGCQGDDDRLSHYLVCSRLWRLVKGSRTLQDYRIPHSALGRLGLQPATVESWKDLVTAQ